ncbi:TetR/AcrR family transcriptional repressor of lmrAB and yxaGH operons [Clostridium tetanomorphum]|uniref:TetR/AcrR family transcriptional regulator n=1 Tax=Clostridium tetanomorphum TaxID=1553 RepID=A0A923J109_CLOTT|nr:TetR/AcrR family transcriptional regulator [Clostridium tetanomorphum]KAJ49985.1 transcriptional regulator, TetR family protein [Clostridium tetanomorphum DSM 665]MBC2398816.1 TetR/AcrR family transcriptional regulator [Clostridium tetanomorphum]MBP1863524.1 TetR/AcrR family transcriptional repressor of lmrAB and yxaGH operons [Clostridium tetanomorphum]NRS83623.1 TetR/AcrR family transcriptional repressor of lmrAB and yxaGH operons [Clostridium tetanomorphum]NRZ96817.1 TetR/AcrR family tra
MKSTKGEQAKQCLIEIASKLFLKNGYSNTGINEILQEANMSKGSFYFYFSSKKELGIEVAKYYGKALLINWLEPLSNNSWDIFVHKMVSDIKSSVSTGNYFGCPIAVLGLEIAFIEDNLSEAYATAITKLINIFSKSLQVSGLSKDKADIIAKKAFALYEGHILYYRICKDESAFDCILNDLLALV